MPQLKPTFWLITSCLLLVVAMAHGQSKRYGLPFMQQYTYKDYKAGLQNMEVIQDAEGLIYVANAHGVLTFDGHTWKKLPQPKSGGANAMTLGPDNKVYVGGMSEIAYVSIDSLGQQRLVSLADSLPEQVRNRLDMVSNAHATSDAVFFTNQRYVIRYKDGRFKVTTYEFPPQGAAGYYLSWVIRDKLYVQAPHDGLLVYENDSLQLVPGGEEARSFPYGITGLLPWGEDELLYTDGKGRVLLFGPSGAKTPDGPVFDQLKSVLRSAQVFKSLEIPGQGYAFLTRNAGVIITNQQFEPVFKIDKSMGLFANNVRGGLVDRHGDLWVAGNGLQHILLSSPVTEVNSKQGVDQGSSRALMKGDTLFLATNYGAMYSQGDRFVPVEGLTKGTSDLDIIDGQLYISDGAAAWLYKPNAPVERIAYGKFEGLHELKNYPGYTVMYPLESDLELLHLDKGRLGNKKRLPGYYGRVDLVAEDRQGYLWASYFRDSLVRIALNETLDSVTYRSFSDADGLATTLGNYVIDYPPAGETGVLIASDENFYTYDSQRDTFLVYGPLAGLIDGLKTSLLEATPDGDLYIYSGRQAALLRKTEDGFVLDTAGFEKVSNLGMYNMYAMPDGSALYLTPDGFRQYSPDALRPGRSDFNTVISQVTSMGKTLYDYDYAESYRLQGGLDFEDNSIDFTYSALFFDNPDASTYSYQLESFDKTWSEWTTSHYKEYTNLPAGTYTFRVRSRNAYGVEGAEASFSFRVFSPWYQSSLAYVGYFFLLSGIVWLIARGYNYRLIKEKERLELIVQERTVEISQQKEEIQLQAEELKESNRQLLELDQFKRDMTSMIVHDLKNPLSVIIRSGQQKTVRLAKKMLNLVLNILDVQKFDDADVKLNLSDISFNELLNSAVEDVRDDFKEKNLQLEVKASQSLYLTADAELLERVIINLLTNAIKYSPASATIVIEVGTSDEASLYFSIQDQGPGIPIDKQSQVFDRYIQVDKKVVTRVKSTGLGLTFCRIVLEAHQGQIGVRSEEGQGAQFWFTLPQAREGEATAIAGITTEEINLTSGEMAAFQVLRPALAKMEVHQGMQIESLLELWMTGTDKGLKALAERLINAAYSGDQDQYNWAIEEATREMP